MKKIIKVLLPLLVLIILQMGCNGQDIDKVIEKYGNTDFSNLKGFSIYLRSAGHQNHTSIYFVNTYDGECSPYAVEFNDQDKTIVNIDNKLVLKSCGKDYLSTEKIAQVVKAYTQYHLLLLQVDNDGNVYINPNRMENATLLRKSISQTPKDFRLFKHYKGNWYIRK